VASAADSLIALHELNRAGERPGADGRGESRATFTG